MVDVDDAQLRLAFVLRLRWVSAGAQALVLVATSVFGGLQVPMAAGIGVVATSAMTTAGLTLWSRRRGVVRSPRPWALAVAIAVDVGLLTMLLALTGGPLNPFTFLYLVHVATASVAVPWAYAASVAAVAIGGYGVLFLVGDDDAHMHHAHEMALHVRGMWFAFAFTAVFVVLFVSSLRVALERRENDRRALRLLEERNRRLASLATLAGGAAHELSTPLSTIAVVASEMQQRLIKQGADAALIDDARLVLSQIERCRGVLTALAADAGEPQGEAFTAVSVAAVIDEAAHDVRAQIQVQVPAGLQVTAPPRALAVALRGLVRNAVEAAQGARVDVSAHTDGEGVCIVIDDDGPGIDGAHLARIGEPFFTTKAPGQGMGLGVFVARTLAERLGGGLRIESAGRGTRVSFSVPARGAA